MTRPVDKIDALRDQYRTLIVQWDEAQNHPTVANRLFDSIHTKYKQLRESDAGRRAITSLLADPVTAVRLLAAGHSLTWEPTRTANALEQIGHEGTLHAASAKWTLRSFREGKLNLDW
jgi:hypothetical protein